MASVETEIDETVWGGSLPVVIVDMQPGITCNENCPAKPPPNGRGAWVKLQSGSIVVFLLKCTKVRQGLRVVYTDQGTTTSTFGLLGLKSFARGASCLVRSRSA